MLHNRYLIDWENKCQVFKYEVIFLNKDTLKNSPYYSCDHFASDHGSFIHPVVQGSSPGTGVGCDQLDEVHSSVCTYTPALDSV